MLKYKIPQIVTLTHIYGSKSVIKKYYKIKELSLRLNSLMLNSRDDKIRTCDHTPPRRVLYRAELHPELRVQMYGFILK